MADGLYNLDKTVTLTSHIRGVTVTPEPLRVENTLLDGSYHVQTIGTSPKRATVDIGATRSEMDNINSYFANSTSVRCEYLTKYLVGKIAAPPSWTRSAYEYFETSLSILVNEEGSLP